MRAKRLFLLPFALWCGICCAQSTYDISVLEIHMKGSSKDITRKLKAVGFTENRKGKCLTGILAGDTVDVYITEKKADSNTIKTSAIRIFQVLPDGSALAFVKRPSDTSTFLGPVVKIESKSGIYYYDDMIIEIKDGEELRAVDTYTYETNNGSIKTVPVVAIFPKERNHTNKKSNKSKPEDEWQW